MGASIRNGRFLAMLLTGAAALMAGCGASSPSAGPASVTTPSAAASPSATPTPTASAASCSSKVLTVLLLGRSKAVAGTAYYPIEFENLAAIPCTLYGFPRVSLTGENYSTRVGAAATSNHGSPEHLITLPPDGSALALLGVANANKYSSGCGQATVSGMIVDPPGLTNSVRLPFSGLTCSNTRYHVLTVNAVVTGPASVGD
jgi:hypothetical protein